MTWYGIIIATRLFNSISLFLESFGGNHQIQSIMQKASVCFA